MNLTTYTATYLVALILIVALATYLIAPVVIDAVRALSRPDVDEIDALARRDRRR